MAFVSKTPSSVYAKLATLSYPKYVAATIATAAAVTYSVVQVLGGFIKRDPAGGARADLFPTAAALREAIDGCEIGTSFWLILRNTADAAETITVTTNTGLTLAGTLTVVQNNTGLFLFTCTNNAIGSEAFTVEKIGTLVH